MGLWLGPIKNCDREGGGGAGGCIIDKRLSTRKEI